MPYRTARPDSPFDKIASMNKNVLDGPLENCCTDPMTGFFRNGRCETCEEDVGLHTVCAVMTDEFLEFSKEHGNDLSTPRPEYDFVGLKAGDCWCICLGRWIEAWQAGMAPRVRLTATHSSVLEHVPLDELAKHAVVVDREVN